MLNGLSPAFTGCATGRVPGAIHSAGAADGTMYPGRGG